MGGYRRAKLPQMLLQRRLDTRLQEVSQPIELSRRHQHEDAGEGQNIGPIPAVDRIRNDATKGSTAARWIDQSGMQLSLSGVVLVAFALAALMALVAGAIARSRYALPVGAAIGFSLPFVFLSFKRTRRLRAFRNSS